jgi:hypothetical protein
MRDETLLGPWVRQFLLEHLVVERNLSRNTQASYRDTLALLLPFASKHGDRAIDRMTVEDLTPSIVRKFLDHLEHDRQCSGVTRNQRLATIRSFAKNTLTTADCGFVEAAFAARVAELRPALRAGAVGSLARSITGRTRRSCHTGASHGLGSECHGPGGGGRGRPIGNRAGYIRGAETSQQRGGMALRQRRPHTRRTAPIPRPCASPVRVGPAVPDLRSAAVGRSSPALYAAAGSRPPGQ